MSFYQENKGELYYSIFNQISNDRKKNHLKRLNTGKVMKYINIKIDYLYHTTPINCEENRVTFQEKMNSNNSFKLPSKNMFSLDLWSMKYFTPYPTNSYVDKYSIQLRYKVKNGYLRLLIIENPLPSTNDLEIDINDIIKCYTMDGNTNIDGLIIFPSIYTDEIHEIMIIRPIFLLEEEFEAVNNSDTKLAKELFKDIIPFVDEEIKDLNSWEFNILEEGNVMTQQYGGFGK
jgi:hypothetical protein